MAESSEAANGHAKPESPDTPRSPRPDISWPVNRPSEQGQWNTDVDAQVRAREALNVQHASPHALAKEFWPNGKRSLPGIALRAFLLGLSLGLGILFTALTIYNGSRLWRAAFFVSSLCIFHFLEFWITAEYNTPVATISSFLLTNGSHYRIAHTIAFIETVLTSYFFPEWQARINPPLVVVCGIIMMAVGQSIRSVAMKQAGTNFNHQVQSQRSEGHVLVTSGVYSFLRHPSYFGFFWWGLGTQVVLGNTVSLMGYAGVLWYFFSTRIRHEEKHLIHFFGDDYVAYRSRTPVWIPFIR